LSAIQVATHHNRLFSEPSTFAGKQHTFNQINKFCISNCSVMWWASSQSQLQLVLFWDYANNQSTYW